MSEIGCECFFLGCFESDGARMLQDAGFQCRNRDKELGEDSAADTAQILQAFDATAVIVDSYHVSDEYIKVLDESGAPVVLIDDFAMLNEYPCSVLLNSALNANTLDYPTERISCFLGPGYSLMRRPLRMLRSSVKACDGKLDQVLVAIGGVDLHGFTERVVKLLLEINDQLSVCIVVGESFKEKERLRGLLKRFQGGGELLVQLPSLGQELKRADLCICGAGMTRDEAAYLGTPCGVLSQNAPQADDTSFFAGKGLAVDLGLGTEISDQVLRERLKDLLNDSERRKQISRACLDFYPKDPTRNAAQELKKVLNIPSKM